MKGSILRISEPETPDSGNDYGLITGRLCPKSTSNRSGNCFRTPPKSIQILDQQNLNDDNLHRTMKKAGMTFFFALGLTMSTTLYSIHDAQAAPPVAVIAEELGYFPVRNQEDEIVYVPARVKRESSEQDILLARALQKSGATMFGTYWCPHTSRQKELFGRQAWEMIPYVECAPQGWKAKPAVCLAQKVDGYPTWVFTKTGQRLSGERPLEQIAEQVHFSGYSAELETDLPVPIGSACKLKK